MGFDEFSNDIKFLRRKAAILAKTDWYQPKFANQFIPLHMDVFRFAAIEAVKEEAIRARNVFNGWHLFLILKSKQLGSLFFAVIMSAAVWALDTRERMPREIAPAHLLAGLSGQFHQ